MGLLVTVYAFTVGLTAAPLTHWTGGWPRKRLYMTVSAVFFLGTVLSAAAESYPILAIGLCEQRTGSSGRLSPDTQPRSPRPAARAAQQPSSSPETQRPVSWASP